MKDECTADRRTSRASTKPQAHAIRESNRGVKVVDGRVVSASLADPAIRRNVTALAEERRKDRGTLLQEYVRQGILTPGGKLSKKYGGK
jgi:hypothetical protein